VLWSHCPNNNFFSNCQYDKSSCLRSVDTLFQTWSPAALKALSPKLVRIWLTRSIRVPPTKWSLLGQALIMRQQSSARWLGACSDNAYGGDPEFMLSQRANRCMKSADLKLVVHVFFQSHFHIYRQSFIHSFIFSASNMFKKRIKNILQGELDNKAVHLLCPMIKKRNTSNYTCSMQIFETCTPQDSF